MINSKNVNNNPSSNSFQASLRAQTRTALPGQQRPKYLQQPMLFPPDTPTLAKELDKQVQMVQRARKSVVVGHYTFEQHNEFDNAANSDPHDVSSLVRTSSTIQEHQRKSASQYSSHAISALSKSNARMLIPYLVGVSGSQQQKRLSSTLGKNLEGSPVATAPASKYNATTVSKQREKQYRTSYGQFFVPTQTSYQVQDYAQVNFGSGEVASDSVIRAEVSSAEDRASGQIVTERAQFPSEQHAFGNRQKEHLNRSFDQVSPTQEQPKLRNSSKAQLQCLNIQGDYDMRLPANIVAVVPEFAQRGSRGSRARKESRTLNSGQLQGVPQIRANQSDLQHKISIFEQESFLRSLRKSEQSLQSQEDQQTGGTLSENHDQGTVIYRRLGKRSKSPETAQGLSSSPKQYYPGQKIKEGIAAKTAELMKRQLVKNIQTAKEQKGNQPRLPELESLGKDSYELPKEIADMLENENNPAVKLNRNLNQKMQSVSQLRKKSLQMMKDRQEGQRTGEYLATGSRNFMNNLAQQSLLQHNGVAYQDVVTDQDEIENQIAIGNASSQPPSNIAQTNELTTARDSLSRGGHKMVQIPFSIRPIKKPERQRRNIGGIAAQDFTQTLMKPHANQFSFRNNYIPQRQVKSLRGSQNVLGSNSSNQQFQFRHQDLRSNRDPASTQNSILRSHWQSREKQQKKERGLHHITIQLNQMKNQKEGAQAADKSPVLIATERDEPLDLTHPRMHTQTNRENDYEEQPLRSAGEQSSSVTMANNLAFYSSIGRYDVKQERTGSLMIARKPPSNHQDSVSRTVNNFRKQQVMKGSTVITSNQIAIRKKLEAEARNIKMQYSSQTAGEYDRQPTSIDIVKFESSTSDKLRGSSEFMRSSLRKNSQGQSIGRNFIDSKQASQEDLVLQGGSELEMVSQMLRSRLSPRRSSRFQQQKQGKYQLPKHKSKRKRSNSKKKQKDATLMGSSRREASNLQVHTGMTPIASEPVIKTVQTENSKEAAKEVGVAPDARSDEAKKEKFIAFDVQDQMTPNLTTMINIDDLQKEVFGRVKVEDRRRQFNLEAQQQPKNPNNTIDHKVHVWWTGVKDPSTTSQADAFADAQNVKKLVIDGYLGPKISNKGAIHFEAGGVTKYVYFKFWIEDPNKNEQAHSRNGSSHSLVGSSGSAPQPENEYKVKLSLTFGKDNFDAASLQKKGIIVCNQDHERDSASARRLDTNDANASQQDTGEAPPSRLSADRGDRTSQAAVHKDHEHQLTSIEGLEASPGNQDSPKKQRRLKKDASNATSNRPYHVADREEIEKILKQYSLTNFKEALEDILNNPDHAGKLKDNFEYLKQTRKSLSKDRINFVNKNAQLAKDTEIKNLKRINSVLLKQQKQQKTTSGHAPQLNTLQPINEVTTAQRPQDGGKHVKYDLSVMSTVQEHQESAAKRLSLLGSSKKPFKSSVTVSKQRMLKQQRWEDRQNEKAQTQVRNFMDKRDQSQNRATLVAQKNEQLMLEERQKKEFLLIKQAVLKKEREDHLINLKNQIIRRCWRVHMCAEIYLQRILLKVCWDGYNLQKLRQWKFKRAVAVARIVRNSGRYLRRYGDAKARHKNVNMPRLLQAQNDQSASVETLKSVTSGRQTASKQGLRSSSRQTSLATLRLQQQHQIQQQQQLTERILPLMNSMQRQKNIKQLISKGKILNAELFADCDDQSLTVVDKTEPASIGVSLKQRERIRQCLTCATMIKSLTEVDENQAKEVFGQFMQRKAIINARMQVFIKYWNRVDKLIKIVKRVLKSHRAQTDVLSEQFDKIRSKFCADIIIANAKSSKKDNFANEILDKLQNMNSFTKIQALSQYMMHARRVYDEEIEKKREKMKAGVSLHTSDILLGNVFLPQNKQGSPSGVSPKKSKDKDKSKNKEEDSENHLKIYNFDQLQRSDEGPESGYFASLGIHPKLWKRITTFHDKYYPKHKSETKKHMAKLQTWLQEPVNKLVYMSQFKYVPTDSLMALVVLAAVANAGDTEFVDRQEKSDRDWFKRKKKQAQEDSY